MKLRYMTLLAATTTLVGLDAAISPAEAAGSGNKISIP